jgi:iron complex transport system ATP-binding protein
MLDSMVIQLQPTLRESSAIAPIRAADLVVRFGSVTALGASTFEMGAATVTALIGANGSGKTTLLHALAGLVVPSSGTIVNPLADDSALVVQQHHQHRWMPLTVAEVVRMGRYRRVGLVGRMGAADHAAIDAAVARADVTDLLDRAFGRLSGGQQQRVRIAQALAAEPALLLLDEPITGLDPPSQERIVALLAAERDAGTTVVFSTHHLDEAREADQVLVLDGAVTAAGPPSEALRPEVLAAAFRGRMMVIDTARDVVLVDDHGHDHDGHGGAT